MALKVSVVASKTDLYKVLRIRERVFVQELKVLEVLEFDANDFRSIHFAFKEGEQVVGTARMRFFKGQEFAKLERLCVLPDFRGKGVLPGVMAQIQRYMMKEKGCHKLFFLCEEALVPIWQAKGFHLISTIAPIPVDKMNLHTMGIDTKTKGPIGVLFTPEEMLKTSGAEQPFVKAWKLPKDSLTYLKQVMMINNTLQNGGRDS